MNHFPSTMFVEENERGKFQLEGKKKATAEPGAHIFQYYRYYTALLLSATVVSKRKEQTKYIEWKLHIQREKT
jgi:hypothetical protein